MDLIKLSHTLSKYVVFVEGNVSKRIENNFLIKASGTSLQSLKESELVACDMDGTQINNFNKKPSMEYLFHSWFYNFSNINFVAHTHPINTLKILCTEQSKLFAEKRLFPDQIVFNGKKSCLVPYGKPGIELFNLIKKNVTEFINIENEIPKLILLQNHGIIAIGNTAEECIAITEICEKSAEIFLGSLPNAKFLSSHEIEDVFSDENEKYRQKIK